MGKTRRNRVAAVLGAGGVSGPGLGGEVLRVSPGGQSTLTTNSSPAGSPPLDLPSDMAFLPNGDIVITDEGRTGGVPDVVEVNPKTGARSLLSGNGRGLGALIRVDLATGNRTVLSDDVTPSGGQQFDTPSDVAYNACENAFYVLQTGFTPGTPPGKVLKVDATTGATLGVRTLFASTRAPRTTPCSSGRP